MVVQIDSLVEMLSRILDSKSYRKIQKSSLLTILAIEISLH